MIPDKSLTMEEFNECRSLYEQHINHWRPMIELTSDQKLWIVAFEQAKKMFGGNKDE